MGQHLSEPITTKETQVLSSPNFRCASSSMQGWRINMEDAHSHFLSLKEDKDASFFAVYDGHGGSRVAQWCGEHVHEDIVANENYKKGDYVQALKSGFLECDENMLKDEEMRDDPSGATAVTVLLKDNKIHCANCGDSRAVASVAGQVQELSFDHKPSNEEETRRIIAAGGYVELNRVNGNLALSRAMGDFIFKRNTKKPPEEQIVIAYPEVIVKDIEPDHEFILLACDGIWDVLSNQEVVSFVRRRIAQKMEPEEICEELLDHCLAPDCQMGGLGCDNMTAVLVCMLHENSYEHLAERCSRIPKTTLTDDNAAATNGEADVEMKADDATTEQSDHVNGNSTEDNRNGDSASSENGSSTTSEENGNESNEHSTSNEMDN